MRRRAGSSVAALPACLDKNLEAFVLNSENSCFFLYMYRASCPVYYSEQQIHITHINSILYTLSTATCFDASISYSGSLNIELC